MQYVGRTSRRLVCEVERDGSALSTRPLGQADLRSEERYAVAFHEVRVSFMTSSSDHGKESPSVLDPETLEHLLRQLETTDIDEFEIVQGNARIYLRREPGHHAGRSPDQRLPLPEQESDFAITAPLTGIFYGRPSPEQAAYVEEGQSVERGQVVALIETMKLFNEVIAELHGEVTRVAVKDGDLVELGQPLVYISPSEPDGTE